MMYRYAFVVAFATALAACHAPPEVAASCVDKSAIDNCDNWIPGSAALCYADGPGPAPYPNLMCGGFGKEGTADGDGIDHWTSWCCAPAEHPVGCDTADDCGAALPGMCIKCQMNVCVEFAADAGSCTTVLGSDGGPG